MGLLRFGEFHPRDLPWRFFKRDDASVSEMIAQGNANIDPDDTLVMFIGPNSNSWKDLIVAFHIASFCCTVVMIVTVFALGCARRVMLQRASFRLTIGLAIMSLIYSTCQILLLGSNSIAGDLTISSNKPAKAVFWLLHFSTLCSIFLVVCLAIQLQVTVLHTREKIARRLNRWYEFLSIVLSLSLTMPQWFVVGTVRWDLKLRAFILGDKDHLRGSIKSCLWGTNYAWVIVGLAYCLFVLLVVFFKLHPIKSIFRSRKRQNQVANEQECWKHWGKDIVGGNDGYSAKLWQAVNDSKTPAPLPARASKASISSSTLTAWGSDGPMSKPYGGSTANPSFVSSVATLNEKNGLETNVFPQMSKEERQKLLVRRSIHRLMLYILTPIVTQVWGVAAFGIVSHPKQAILIIVGIMSAFQSLLLLVSLFLNPSVSEAWYWVRKRTFVRRIIRKVRRRRNHGKYASSRSVWQQGSLSRQNTTFKSRKSLEASESDSASNPFGPGAVAAHTPPPRDLQRGRKNRRSSNTKMARRASEVSPTRAAAFVFNTSNSNPPTASLEGIPEASPPLVPQQAHVQGSNTVQEEERRKAMDNGSISWDIDIEAGSVTEDTSAPTWKLDKGEAAELADAQPIDPASDAWKDELLKSDEADAESPRSRSNSTASESRNKVSSPSPVIMRRTLPSRMNKNRYSIRPATVYEFNNYFGELSDAGPSGIAQSSTPGNVKPSELDNKGSEGDVGNIGTRSLTRRSSLPNSSSHGKRNASSN
ncbi:hypothetical protein H4219_004046 [Mycoemilia scoparia]|uniref:G-protein coupled receptors family 2 profile 2 domain-containing protein n=1 Tax=Mycoemilia scoparia TaxID=417184 RepID=A0A9W7ZSX1_9FUNG|nr:hypothetical protein H4219_004046 [Mycoemilia scoparia]